MKMNFLSASIFGGFLLFFSAVMLNPLRADDTEIYFGEGSGDTVMPNVLLILDTSSSMTADVPGTGKNRLENMKDALRDLISNSNNVKMGLMRFHRYGGPVLFPIADLEADVTDVIGAEAPGDVYSKIQTAADDATQLGTAVDLSSSDIAINFRNGTNVTQEIRIDSTNDDAEQQVASGSMYRNSSDLELTLEDNEQVVGMRFNGLAVPPAVLITSAEIEFAIDEFYSSTTNLRVFGEAVDDADSFSSTDFDISNRPETTASINWLSLPAKNVGEKLTTPDISSIIQELVCRGSAAVPCSGGPGNWLAGNDVVLMIDGVAGSKRTVESADGDATKAPLLRVTYTDPLGPVGDQLVGLRFQRLDIPQGATITTAVLEVRTAAAGADNLVTEISAHDTDDSPAFMASINNLSTRTKTGAKVDWDLTTDPWAGADENKQSVDISSVIQEVVDRGGWCGGNALALLLKTKTPGLQRLIKAYDSGSVNAPALRIKYDVNSSPNGCMEQTLQRQIAGSSNDVEEEVSNGQMSSTSSDLEMVDDGGDQVIGLRFSNLSLPQNATVLNARIVFTAKDASSSTTDLVVRAQAIGDAPAFGTTNYDLSSRALTSAQVAWSVQDWNAAYQVDQTPDLTTVVKEVVDRADWAPGNDMVFHISGSGLRRAFSSDGQSTAAPALVVTIQGSLASGTQTVRNRLLSIVDEIEYKSGTPIVDTLYEGALYYTGLPVDYGRVRGDQGSRAEYTRVSHAASFTGGNIIHDPVCDDNPNDLACVSEVIDGAPVYKTPVELSCQPNHIVLLSDGAPSVNTSQAKVAALIGAACANTGNSAEKCGRELIDYLQQVDQLPGMSDKQIINTWTIGFNLGWDENDPGPNPMPDEVSFLNELAALGNGEFFTADTAGDLTEAFDAILTSILDAPSSFAAPSISINAFNKLVHRNDIYFSLFEPNKDKRWSGNVKKYSICEGKPADTCTLGEVMDGHTPTPEPAIGADSRIRGDAQSIWTSFEDGPEIEEGGAGEQVPDFVNRNIYTYTAAVAPVDVDLTLPAHLLEDTNVALTETLFGVLAAERSALIDWVRGRDVDDENNDGSVADNRWTFPDPLHSSPVAVTYGCNGVSPGSTCATNAPAIIKIFTAGNDGSIRMLNGATGEEEWAFFPQKMLSLQKDLRGNLEGDHIYGIDSTPTLWVQDVNNDGIIDPAHDADPEKSDFVRVFYSMRRGGSNMYALDVTPDLAALSDDTTGLVSPKLMWRLEGGTTLFNHMGQTWSRPLINKIQTKVGGQYETTVVAIFGGGYDDAQDSLFGTSNEGNAIYIVDARTGDRIWWASNATATDGNLDPPNLVLSGMDYSIPSNLALLDGHRDGVIDRMYVGDLGGQVWRIDLGADISASNSGPGGSTGGRLAMLSDGAVDQDKRKFFEAPDVIEVDDEVFSDVAEYDLVTIVSGDRANPLETGVLNRVYALRDDNVGEVLSETGVYPLGHNRDGDSDGDNDLYDATDNFLQVGSTVQKTAAKESLRKGDGWFIDLTEPPAGTLAGEKGLSSPIVLDGKLFFTTFVPGIVTDPCQAIEGIGRLYGIDVLSGVAEFDDWGGVDDDNFETADRIYELGGGIPSSAVPIFQDQGVTLLIGTGGGAESVDPDINLPRVRTYWYQK
ncbi:MAG: hypothetical protein DRQ52_02760 [Gammaproteobacteria bacterium]|nr:MAG: hypothetical protein DRQ52_02760 [Gammaproteobacteria bacterium]